MKKVYEKLNLEVLEFEKERIMLSEDPKIFFSTNGVDDLGEIE